VDEARLWPHHLPAVRAADEQVASVERHVGFALDARYVAFLRHANGWRGFYQAVDLFGTSELMGNDLMTYAQRLLEAMEPETLTESDVRRDELLPVATTREDRDLFVLIEPTGRLAGQVIWFAGTEDYNRRAVEKTREKYPRVR
jgi:hypothetical protein